VTVGSFAEPSVLTFVLFFRVQVRLNLWFWF